MIYKKQDLAIIRVIMAGAPERRGDRDPVERGIPNASALPRPQRVITDASRDGVVVKEGMAAMRAQIEADLLESGGAVVQAVDPGAEATDRTETRLELPQLQAALGELGMLLVPPNNPKARNKVFVIIFLPFSPAPYALGNNENWFMNLTTSDIRFLFAVLKTQFDDTNRNRLRRIEEYLNARRLLPSVDDLVMELDAIN